jgi:hypothetical protein
MSKQSDLVSVSQGSGGDPLYIDTTNDRVGIGTTSPSTLAHLKSSGDYAALTIETATTGGASYINLGDSNDLDVGQIAYYNSDDSLRMKVNASERMRIDSSGRVTMPYQPAFMAIGLDTTAPSGSDTLMRFNTTTFNTGGHYNTSTYRFTAPVTGVYYFHCQTRLVGVSGNGRYDMVFRKNGTGAMGGGQNQQGNNDAGFNVSAFLSLAANDYVDVVINQNNGSSVNTNNGLNTSQGGTQAATHFFGYLVK